MSQSTLKQRKTAVTAAAPMTTDYVPMEAMSYGDLKRPHGGNSKEARQWGPFWFLSLEGKHTPQSWPKRLYNFIMEVVGVFVLGMVASLGSFVAGPTVNVANSLALAAAIAGAYMVMSRLYSDYALRRHLNPAFTIGYLFTGDVGVFGLLYYWIAQVLGALFSGLVTGTILSEQDGGCVNAAACPAGLVRAVVPLPTTLNGAHGLGISQTTLICLEIFIPMIITLVLLLKEHLNTRGSVKDNYKHATKCAALALFVFITVGHPFQVYSFNGATYLAGIFSGMTTSFHGRSIHELATLSSTTLLANSVFGPSGGPAWALYFFGNLAGGFAAGLVGLVIMYMGFKNNTMYSDFKRLKEGKYQSIHSEIPPIQEDVNTPLLVAAQTTHTAVSDLVNPYSVNSGIAASVLGK